MKKSKFDLNCPVARTLESVGDPWCLLIVRDALMGVTRFKVFERSLKISKNILSDRLDKLIQFGVLEKERASETGWPEYTLTQKGRELAPVILELGKWGIKWNEME
jgi:DNA-binding HxlR family transcriptional regulator